jgi:small GTP-binding protein
MQRRSEVVSGYRSKVLLVGSDGAGKSAFLEQYCSKEYKDKYVPTIVTDFKTIDLSDKHDRQIRLQIWDTAGQERYKDKIDSYYSGASTIVYFVDVMKPLDQNDIKHYRAKIASVMGNDVQPTVIVVMSKSDLDPEKKHFNEEQLESELNGLNFQHDSILTITATSKDGIQPLVDELRSSAVAKAKDAAVKEDAAAKKRQISQAPGLLSEKTGPAKKNSMWQRVQQALAKRPYAASIMAGLAFGVALSATGVFAPFGAGVLGIIGLSVAGGVAFGLITAVVKKLYQSKWEADFKKRHHGPTLEAVQNRTPSLTGQRFQSQERSFVQYRRFFPSVCMSSEQIVSELQQLNQEELLSLHAFCTACSPSGSGKVVEKPDCAKKFDIKSKQDKDNILKYIDVTDIYNLKVVQNPDAMAVIGPR